MSFQVLDARPDASGGYKVDVSRGSRVGRVSSEWFSRPDDERFLSLTDLQASVRSRAERSRTKVVESAAIRVEAAREDHETLTLALPGGEAPLAPTHWSFGQLASLVGGKHDAGELAGLFKLLPGLKKPEAALNGLSNGGTHGKDGLEKPTDSDQCHDITVFPKAKIAAGACSGSRTASGCGSKVTTTDGTSAARARRRPRVARFSRQRRSSSRRRAPGGSPSLTTTPVRSAPCRAWPGPGSSRAGRAW